MASFQSQMNAAAAEVEAYHRRVFDVAVELTKQSIQFGSELTGAPGQPVDTGALRNSWMVEKPSPDRAIISTNMEYAPPIEDGVGPHGPLTLRSAVGGFHSQALTVAGFPRILQAAIESQAGRTDTGGGPAPDVTVTPLWTP